MPGGQRKAPWSPRHQWPGGHGWSSKEERPGGKSIRLRRVARGAPDSLFPLLPKAPTSSLQTGSYLATGSGTRRGRGGTLPDSGLLQLPGMYAQGRPGGPPGGSHFLQDSSGQRGRPEWPGCLQSKGCPHFSPQIRLPQVSLRKQHIPGCATGPTVPRLTCFAPAPRGARPTVLFLLGSRVSHQCVRWTRNGLSTALRAVKS